ncbi:transcription initiation factor TFIID subunit 13 isoform X1 [Calonectris borealis]|uniref:transcription initiation factor TFIID subunit 13 isoform X1 n=1 Tax=Calonectris borealis TaxID=1323832 RepID=UPI003F4B0DEA
MADEEEDAPFEEDAEEAGGGLDGGQGKRKRLFSKEPETLRRQLWSSETQFSLAMQWLSFCALTESAETCRVDPPKNTANASSEPNCAKVRCMMYGFGDDQNPYTESVDILEDLVIEFITEMTHKAMSIGRQGRVQVEDIVFLIRKDPRKFARVKDLLTMNEELKRARKAFDEANYGS